MTLRNLLLPPLVLGLLWVAAVWWPAQMLLEREQRELDTQQTQQLSLVSEIDELNQQTDILERIDADRARIDTAVPPNENIDEFLAVIAEQATSAGVNVRVVSPMQILGSDSADPFRPVPGGISAVVFSTSADGSFPAVMTFVRELQELDRMVVVDTLALSAVEGADRVTVDLGFRVFTTGEGEVSSTGVELTESEAATPGREREQETS